MQRWIMAFITRMSRQRAAIAMKVKLQLMVVVPRRHHFTNRIYKLVLAENSLNPSWGIYLTTILTIIPRMKCLKKTVSGAK